MIPAWAILPAAWSLLAFGALVNGLNFDLSFLRQPLHRRRGRDLPWNVFGLPLVGAAASWAAAMVFGQVGRTGMEWFAYAVLLLDTGSPHWLPIATLMHWHGQRRRRPVNEPSIRRTRRTEPPA